MKEYSSRVKELKSHATANHLSTQTNSSLILEDNRPLSVIQKKSSQLTDNRTEASLATGTFHLADNRALQKKANKTGLPDSLKASIENLSGHSLDDVKVHYNSAQPAQLKALAYAQGTNIHVGPGQEQHLPHEAWHVVQQKQGRVQPTTQLKSGLSVNDNKGLEAEANIMGAKAMAPGSSGSASVMKANLPVQRRAMPDVMQPVWEHGSNSLAPNAKFVDWDTGNTYNPNTKELINGNTQDRNKLTEEDHHSIMADIKSDRENTMSKSFIGLNKFRNFPTLIDIALKAEEKIGNDLPQRDKEVAMNKVISYLTEMMPFIEALYFLRPITLNATLKSLEDSALLIAENKAPAFNEKGLFETVEQEKLALKLISLSSKKDAGGFKDTLDAAYPVVTKTNNGYKIVLFLGDIELGEVTLVMLDHTTLEMHFNVSSPLMYIGVASHLWQKGVAEIDRLDSQIRKMNIIMPAYSHASTLIVNRQVAAAGGDAEDYKRGLAARGARKETESTDSSSSHKQELFKSGDADDSTGDELKHYLMSIAKTIYTRKFGIIGYISPWKLINVYGLDINKLGSGLEAANHKMMENTGTIAGLIEVAECHKLLGIPYQPDKFIPAVVSQRIKLMLGMNGGSFIDFSLRKKTWDTAKRWLELR